MNRWLLVVGGAVLVLLLLSTLGLAHRVRQLDDEVSGLEAHLRGRGGQPRDGSPFPGTPAPPGPGRPGHGGPGNFGEGPFGGDLPGPPAHDGGQEHFGPWGGPPGGIPGPDSDDSRDEGREHPGDPEPGSDEEHDHQSPGHLDDQDHEDDS